jgi:hypothetical protein
MRMKRVGQMTNKKRGKDNEASRKRGTMWRKWSEEEGMLSEQGRRCAIRLLRSSEARRVDMVASAGGCPPVPPRQRADSNRALRVTEFLAWSFLTVSAR